MELHAEPGRAEGPLHYTVFLPVLPPACPNPAKVDAWVDYGAQMGDKIRIRPKPLSQFS
jgi:hypothetical protein